MCELSTVTPLWLFGKSHDVRCVSELKAKARECANTVLTRCLVHFLIFSSNSSPRSCSCVRREDTALLAEHTKKREIERENQAIATTAIDIMHWQFHLFFFYFHYSLSHFPSPSIPFFMSHVFFSFQHDNCLYFCKSCEWKYTTIERNKTK